MVNLESGDITYGVTDEASKLPLGLTNVIQLMAVPNMTLPVAEALADFVDADSLSRDNGEQETYDMLPSPTRYPTGRSVFSTNYSRTRCHRRTSLRRGCQPQLQARFK